MILVDKYIRNIHRNLGKISRILSRVSSKGPRMFFWKYHTSAHYRIWRGSLFIPSRVSQRKVCTFLVRHLETEMERFNIFRKRRLHSEGCLWGSKLATRGGVIFSFILIPSPPPPPMCILKRN